MKLKTVPSIICGMAIVGTVSAELLMGVDFSGTPGGFTTIAATDGQVTTHANLNYTDPAALSAVGGSSGTSGWAIDATGSAAANTDLHTVSTFGAPTRFDLFLGFADTGYSYTITNVEIVVRAVANGSKNWDFMYRDGVGSTHIVNGSAIAAQTGANPLTTYSIDLTSEGLDATDSATDWNTGGTGRLRVAFWAADGANNDNLQIDAVRLNGTVIPEPATLGMIALMGGGLLFVRRLMM